MNSGWHNKAINKDGYNELKGKEKETLIQKVIKQLNDFLVLILIITSIVSGITGEISHAIIIIVVVIVYVILGAVSCTDGITPLQVILNQLGIWLGITCLFICALGFSIGFLRDGHLLELILVTLSLVVAAIWKGCQLW